MTWTLLMGSHVEQAMSACVGVWMYEVLFEVAVGLSVTPVFEIVLKRVLLLKMRKDYVEIA